MALPESGAASWQMASLAAVLAALGDIEKHFNIVKKLISR